MLWFVYDDLWFEKIKNTDKVRKWHKKARAQLRKLPSSMFEAVIKKEYGY